MLCYNDISDFEFYVLTIALSVYLFILTGNNDNSDNSKHDKREHFVEVESEENDKQKVYVEEEQYNQQVTFPMFFALPTKIKEIIIPKWDYVIQSVSGSSGSDGDDETQDITEQTFIQNKDSTIVNPDDPKTVVKDKYNKVVDTYKTMDNVLNTLRILDKDKYDIVLQESI